MNTLKNPEALTARQVMQVAQELSPHRLVQVIARLDAVLDLWHQQPIGVEWAARCGVQQHERQRRDQQERRDRREQPAQKVTRHAITLGVRAGKCIATNCDPECCWSSRARTI